MLCQSCAARRRSGSTTVLTERRAPKPVGRAGEAHAFGRGLDPSSQRQVIARYFGSPATRAPTATAAPGPSPSPGEGAPAVPGTGEWWRRRWEQSRTEARPSGGTGELDPGGWDAAPEVGGRAAEPRGGGWDAVPEVGHRAAEPLVDGPGLGASPPPPPRPAPRARPIVIGGAAPAAAPSVAGRAPAASAVGAPGPARLRPARDRHAVGIALGVFVLAVAALLAAPTPVRHATQTQARDRAAVVPAPSPATAGSPAAASPGPRPSAAEPSGGSEAGASSGCLNCASSLSADSLEMVGAINAARARAGSPELVSDADLGLVAERHVDDMLDRHRLFHTANGVLARRVTDWSVLAESIGIGPNVDALVRAFLQSDADRRNLLDPTFRHVGVATTLKGRRLWVTVLFSDSADPGTTLAPLSG
jgi:uncharacterized protein YkwD